VRIERLEESVINQIAAGEVIEQPSSVVKELVENAIDAGATEIRIGVDGGGLSQILVEDNGSGIAKEDLPLALVAHATSKLRRLDDLDQLVTMGFRGEALAAIGSVSQVEIVTSSGQEAFRLNREGAIVSACRNRGTTIEVRSLFYNAPARRKFQKSGAALLAQIKKTVLAFALGYEEIDFFLNGEKVEGRFQGRKVEGPRVRGQIGAPEEAKPTRRDQWLFVNKRVVVSPLISRAVASGYGTRIAEGMHPPFLLFLNWPQEEIDINVHPQKREIRFLKEGEVFRMVEEAVRRSFAPEMKSAEPLASVAPFSWAYREETLPWIEARELPIAPIERTLGLFGSVLLLEEEGAIRAFDVAAGRSHLLFEGMEGRGEKEAHPLLFPIEAPLVEQEGLADLGIEARLLRTQLVIDAIPSWLKEEEVVEVVLALQDKRRRASLASQIARRRRYSIEEALQIWQKVKGIPFCPMGRPIAKKIVPEEWFHATAN
jgi:DNA mismatch repair protein MutL